MCKNYQVIFTEKSRVEVQEVAMPQMGPNQVLIETEVSQISTGTELTMLEANVDEDSPWHLNIKFPNFPGYSNVGKIIQVGENVDASLLGKRVYSSGKHTKYAVVNADTVALIPDDVDSEEAVFASLATVAMGSIRIADIRPSDTVVVYGAGIIGQMLARLAKIAGAGHVFVTDVSDYRLSMLPQDACFHKVNTTKEDVVETLKTHGKKELARIVFESTSVPSLIAKELLCLQPLGRLIITSSPKGKSTVDFDFVNRQGITIIGAHNGKVHPPVATPANPWTVVADKRNFMDLLSQKEITTKHLNTHKEHYTQAPRLYEMLMKDRTQAMSVLLDWRD